MDLFDQTINSTLFSEMPIIIFFNKTDLFKEKLLHKDLTVAFPEYTGGVDFEAAKNYIREQFLSRNKHDASRIHSYFTSALDTENVKQVTEDVMMTLAKIKIDTL